MTKTGRLFFAVIPEAEIRQDIYRYARCIRRSATEKIMPLEKLHMTLRYIGQVDEGQLDCLIKRVDALHSERFELELDHIDFWAQSKICWFGSRHKTAALTRLVNKLDKICQQCALPKNDKPFIAHMTAIRRAEPRPAAPLSNPFVLQFKRFYLLESSPGQSGAYEVIRTWSLSESITIM